MAQPEFVAQTAPHAKRRLAPCRHSFRPPHLPCLPLPISPPSPFPPCPFLPLPRAGLDWRTLHVHREDARGAVFYHDCLEYAHALWQRGLAARAILCLDRALGADLRGDEPALRNWPPPYAALVWLLHYATPAALVGNPRVHFQHYAGRLRGPREDARRARAWACWALTRVVLPHLPNDPNHAVTEPDFAEIMGQLRTHGWPGEAEAWQKIIATAGTNPPPA